jgi:hypothetical protein
LTAEFAASSPARRPVTCGSLVEDDSSSNGPDPHAGATGSVQDRPQTRGCRKVPVRGHQQQRSRRGCRPDARREERGVRGHGRDRPSCGRIAVGAGRAIFPEGVRHARGGGVARAAARTARIADRRPRPGSSSRVEAIREALNQGRSQSSRPNLSGAGEDAPRSAIQGPQKVAPATPDRPGLSQPAPPQSAAAPTAPVSTNPASLRGSSGLSRS